MEEEVDGKSPSFVGAHLRNQLQYDLWYIFLGLFIIAIVEGRRIESKEQYVSHTSARLEDLMLVDAQVKATGIHTLRDFV